MKISQIFCKHDYKLIAIRKSNYTSDYVLFSDLGMYDDFLYECKKCEKKRLSTKMNETHPLFQKWKKVGE